MIDPLNYSENREQFWPSEQPSEVAGRRRTLDGVR